IVVSGAVIISTIVSLTLTPMMSARMLRQSKKQNRFFQKTEAMFNSLAEAYGNSLLIFMKHRWIAFAIMILSMGIIFGIGSQIPSELAPLEDKSRFTVIASAPEGVSFELMDRYMVEMMQMLDTFPEKKTGLTVSAPSFRASTSMNSGFARIALTHPSQR